MNIETATADVSVQDMLRAIEDKLYETGMLVTATGDPESDVTLGFTTMAVDGETLPVFTVAITSAAPGVEQRLACEKLCHYVMHKYADLLPELPEALREVLLDSVGPIVSVNGVRAVIRETGTEEVKRKVEGRVQF